MGCWLGALGCCFIVLGSLRSISLATALPGGELLTLPIAFTQCWRFSLTLFALGLAMLKWSFVLDEHAYDLKVRCILRCLRRCRCLILSRAHAPPSCCAS